MVPLTIATFSVLVLLLVLMRSLSARQMVTTAWKFVVRQHQQLFDWFDPRRKIGVVGPFSHKPSLGVVGRRQSSAGLSAPGGTPEVVTRDLADVYTAFNGRNVCLSSMGASPDGSHFKNLPPKGE